MELSRTKMNAEFRHEIEVAARLARSAGAIIMQIYQTKFVVKSKGKEGPVTEADQRANDVIVEGLQREFPRDGICSEERPVCVGEQQDGRVWYVDPLDGTREFVEKRDEFSVMIGLAIDGQALLGLVYRPTDGALFGGIADRGAWHEEHGRRVRLTVTSETDPRRLRLAVSRSHRDRLIDDMRVRIGITQETRCGSVGVKIALLATRQADVYLEPSGVTSAWDICAPEAVLRGAGGRVTDLAGDPLVYAARNVRNRRGLVATNRACHDDVVAAIAPVVREAKLI